MVITETVTKTITCKNCGSPAVVRFGTYKGVQRYYCKSCKRKFKADDTAFHAKVSNEWAGSAVDMYYRGMSIHDISEHLKQEHGYAPSKSIIGKWIEKYTNLASKQFKDDKPQVGDRWVADETMLDVDGQHKLWFYDIIDAKTKYLLASRVAIARTTHDAEVLMRAAVKRAGKLPKEIITDANRSYDDGIELVCGADTYHVQGNPFKKRETGKSTSEIERFHGTLKDRTKVFRAFRNFETLKQFTDGWLIYYNYFKAHEALKDKTPAEAAHIDYKIKNWADLARVPVAKQSSNHIPKTQIVIEKISLEQAYSRHRLPKISTPSQRITQPKVRPHHRRRGRIIW